MVCISGCNTIQKPEESKTLSLKAPEQKVYYIPTVLQEESYSVEEFKHLYSEYLKLNNITLQTSPENDKTEILYHI